jgi:hypothetical protein
MRKRVRNAIRAGVVLGAVGASMFAMTGGAQAYTYDGQDPSSTGCSSGATTVASAGMYTPEGHIHVGVIEMRYSVACHTGWARLTLDQTQGACGNASAGYACPSAFITRNNDGRTYRCEIDQNQSQCYTAMVYDKGLTSFAEGVIDSVSGIIDVRTAAY